MPHAYVELHIEQGPVLDAAGEVIGAVSGIQGISWQELVISGQANHAGTTPMAYRHDAGFVAASVATFVRRMVNEIGPPQVGTVGRLDLHPDLVNVVAAKATMTVDLRNTDEDTLQERRTPARQLRRRLAGGEGVQVTSRRLARFEPVEFDPRMISLVEDTARSFGYTARRLPAGAGHDAQMLARVCPAGMIFVPSVGGISHNPGEFTRPEHLAAGADMLLQMLVRLAEEDDIPVHSPTVAPRAETKLPVDQRTDCSRRPAGPGRLATRPGRGGRAAHRAAAEGPPPPSRAGGLPGAGA